jgi:hypothetical protein
MHIPRRFLLFTACGLALGASPAGLAQSSGISTQIAKIKQALSNDKVRPLDLKGLKDAAWSLTQKRPAALEEPAPPDGDKAYEVNDATADLAYLPQLTLTDEQREVLFMAYQDYAENIATIARRQPFDQPAADQIKGAVAALQQFMSRLNALLPMDRTSTAYKKAVATLVHEEQNKKR